MPPLARFLASLAGRDLAALSDGALLARYAADGDEASFAELVRRHAPMAAGAARRVLGGRDGADDCAQAAFLVLARSAGKLAGQASVGGWLHGVAVRCALRLRTRECRRQRVEARAARPEAFTPPAPDDTAAAVDRAVRSLPARLRDAVVLCELEGVPRPEAAARLGVPVGTLSSRLATAHARLARKLARSAGTVAAALAAARSADAAVPLLFLSPARAVPGAVSTLVLEVSRAMLFTKLKLAAACGTLALGVAGTTAGVARYAHADDPRPGSGPPAASAKPADPAPPAAPPADAPGAKIGKLRLDRLEALKRRARGVRAIVDSGAVGGAGVQVDVFGPGGLGSADQEALEAELELAPDHAARVKVREKMVESAAFWDEFLRKRQLGGIGREADMWRQHAARLAAEIALEQEKAGAGQGAAAKPAARPDVWAAVTPAGMRAVRAEAGLLAGAWVLESWTVGGRPVPVRPDSAQYRLGFSGDTVCLHTPEAGGPPVVYTSLLNVRATPKQLMLCGGEGGEDGPRRLVYSYELAAGRLRLAWYPGDDAPPAGFAPAGVPARDAELNVATYVRGPAPKPGPGLGRPAAPGGLFPGAAPPGR